jgi:hypothetical protein
LIALIFKTTTMLKRILAFSLLVSLIIVACKKDNGTYGDVVVPVDDSKTVSASISVIVVNESNAPVPGATVIAGTQTTTTDSYGFFRFNNINISEHNAWVKVTKTGYFNGSRSFMTSPGRLQAVRIKLLARQVAGTIIGSTGGNVLLSSGAKLMLPPGAVVDASGAPYSGTINVAMKWLDPSDNNIAYTMPGDLRGIVANGSERSLSTYGMMAVELSGSSGQELKIASGKKAELTFPIPSSLQASAPASIPLWHFDETKGRWMEEGSATRVGNNYVGQVAHFSFWNCDVPGNFVTLCVHATTPGGQPLINATIRITKVGNPAAAGFGQTDSLGDVCGAVPQNEALVLDVLNNCSGSVYTQNIGPYSANASVNVVATITPVNSLILTGNVKNCSNGIVNNGAVIVYLSNGFFVTAPVTATGSFSVTILNCSGNTVGYTLVATDFTTQQQSLPVTGTAGLGTVNLGTISACGASSAQFIHLLIDGVAYNWSAPVDSLVSYTGGGPYTHVAIAGFTHSDPNNNYRFVFGPFTTVGSYQLINGELTLTALNQTTLQQTNPVQVAYANITECGLPGIGFIAGNFNANFVFQPGNVIRNVSGSFRHRCPQ